MPVHQVFGQQLARDYFDKCLVDMEKEIDAKGNDYILNVNAQEWKQYYVDKYDFEPLEVFADKATVSSAGTGKKSVREYGDTYEVEYHIFQLKVPFTGWSFLFMLKPSSWTMKSAQVETPSQANSGFVTGTFKLRGENEQEFLNEKKSLLDAITSNVPNINKDLHAFKQQVKQRFDWGYGAKKQKVLSQNAFFEKLNIQIDPSTDKIYKVPVAVKKKIPEPVVDKKKTRQYSDTPTLPDEFYNDILDVINTFFKSVEKKPSTYQAKDEEGLRDYVLPTLETRYSNTTVTGETFNKGGKTDILVKHTDGTNVFVAECKYWKGEGVFHETINQLFDKYLTWRDSKVAIVFFVTNKAFSKVLQTIRESVKKHPYFLRENGTRGESSLSYIFHFPTDKGKFIYTEIMAFHFPE